MATKGKLISDIELRLTGGKPSDDFELEPSQIGHWLEIGRDELVKLTLDEQILKGYSLDSYYIEKITCEGTVIEQEGCEGDCLSEMLLVLPEEPLSLAMDKGIVQIKTSAGDTVDRATIHDFDIITDLPFSAPKEENLVWRREGGNVYISGMPEEDIDLTTFTVYYVPSYANTEIDYSDEFKLQGDLLGVLLDDVEQLGKRQVYGEQDLENDGEQDLTN